MRTRTVVAATVASILLITALNLFSDNATLLARLPETRSAARREALQTPFLLREHRLERKPRLESASVQTAASPTEDGSRAWLASTSNSQRLQKANVAKAGEEKRRAKYHVVPSVDGGIYTEWQIRICYYWYKKVKRKFPESAMGGFTRLLHSGKADAYMDEIPTVVVDPLPEGIDGGYVVLNRPFAYYQWVLKFMRSIPEDYVLMAEPDHLLVLPPPLWATPSKAAAFPFSYIIPWKYPEIMKRYNPKNVSLSDMAQIGNAPVQIHKNQLEGIVEIWYNTSLRMKQDPEVSKTFGWVLDMYAYSISSSQAEGKPIPYELHSELMAQPPFDADMDFRGAPFCIMHYTYGLDFDRTGDHIYGRPGNYFHWDKREYQDRYPPRPLPSLPADIKSPATKYMLDAINEAAATLTWRTEAEQ